MGNEMNLCPSYPRCSIPNAPCIEYLPTFTISFDPHVGRYTIHGASGYGIAVDVSRQTRKIWCAGLAENGIRRAAQQTSDLTFGTSLVFTEIRREGW